MLPPFDLPEGITFDGVQECLGRKLLCFTDAAQTGSSFMLKSETANAQALADRVQALRLSFSPAL
jgi:hypothetical protein